MTFWKLKGGICFFSPANTGADPVSLPQMAGLCTPWLSPFSWPHSCCTTGSSSQSFSTLGSSSNLPTLDHKPNLTLAARRGPPTSAPWNVHLFCRYVLMWVKSLCAASRPSCLFSWLILIIITRHLEWKVCSLFSTVSSFLPLPKGSQFLPFDALLFSWPMSCPYLDQAPFPFLKLLYKWST